MVQWNNGCISNISYLSFRVIYIPLIDLQCTAWIDLDCIGFAHDSTTGAKTPKMCVVFGRRVDTGET